MSSHNLLVWSQSRRLAVIIHWKECHILHFELLRLLLWRPRACPHVLSNPQQEIETIITKSPTAGTNCIANDVNPNFTNNSGMSASTGSFLTVGGSSFDRQSLVRPPHFRGIYPKVHGNLLLCQDCSSQFGRPVLGMGPPESEGPVPKIGHRSTNGAS